MTLKEYIDALTHILKKDPKIYGKMKVVYAVDEEGNDFKEVFYKPNIGHFEKSGSMGDFSPVVKGSTETEEGKSPNAVCIN